MSVDDVRDVINVSAADVPDSKVLKMIKRAEVTLKLGREQPFLADYLFARFLELSDLWSNSVQ